jgi:hypothetical protein
LAVAGVLTAGTATAQEWVSGIKWQEPPVVDPGPPGGPPSDATVLFGGSELSQWNGGRRWEIADGVATCRGGSITTKESFGDCQMHVEWASPAQVRGRGQGRGNSGIYLMGQYEIQILDSYDNETYFDGQAGALYKTAPPMVNVSRKPGEWQTYDIIFRAPRFEESGELKEPGYITVLHNGVVIHNHTKILGTTAWTDPPTYTAHPEKAPITIQDHGNPVRFRNIWIREIKPVEGKIDKDAPEAETVLERYPNVVAE